MPHEISRYINNVILIRCKQERIVDSGVTWYPQSNISNCCSLDYDSTMTEYKDEMKNVYNFKDGNAIQAIGNIIMDTVQGMYNCNI